MATDRRKLAVLVLLVIVLAGAMYMVLPEPSGNDAPASNPGSDRAVAQARAPAVTAPDVHLDDLNSARPKPINEHRNLFAFKPKPAPVVSTPPRQQAPLPPPPPPGPPPLPPIPLKFIGTVQQNQVTVGVLSDGQGAPMYGREGDTIAGRYRILRIGAESIEMSYLDGQGRQTIRRTGS